MNQPSAAALLSPGVFSTPRTREQILQAWIDADKAMREAKETERAARDEVIAALGFTSDKKEGTERVPLANGWELKAVKKLNYNLKNGAGETDAALDKLEKFGDDGKFLAERLVSWKPTISTKEYKELSPAQQLLFKDCLTITDGAPSLELIEPKAK